MQRPGSQTTSSARSPLHYGKRAVLLVLAGASLYLLLPSLLAVFGSWRSLSHLDWPFAGLVVASEVSSYICLWQLDPGSRSERRGGFPSRRRS